MAIETYSIPIDSDFHGDDPCKIWAPGIDQVFSILDHRDGVVGNITLGGQRIVMMTS